MSAHSVFLEAAHSVFLEGVFPGASGLTVSQSHSQLSQSRLPGSVGPMNVHGLFHNSPQFPSKFHCLPVSFFKLFASFFTKKSTKSKNFLVECHMMEVFWLWRRLWRLWRWFSANLKLKSLVLEIPWLLGTVKRLVDFASLCLSKEPTLEKGKSSLGQKFFSPKRKIIQQNKGEESRQLPHGSATDFDWAHKAK